MHPYGPAYGLDCIKIRVPASGAPSYVTTVLESTDAATRELYGAQCVI